MNFTFHTFPCPEGGHMRWAKGPDATSPRGTVLICPGMGEWIEKYDHTIEKLHARGFNTLIFEWRGQGRSSRFLKDDTFKTHIPSFETLIADLDVFYRSVVEQHEPVTILAHSMGGQLALRWRCGKGADIDIERLVISNPLVMPNTSPFPLVLAQWITKRAMAKGLGEEYAPRQKKFNALAVPFAANPLTSDKTRYEELHSYLRANPDVLMGGVSNATVSEIFAGGPALLNGLKQNHPDEPCQLLVSPGDKKILASEVYRMAKLMPQAELVLFRAARHELLQEREEVQTKLWGAFDEFTRNIRRSQPRRLRLRALPTTQPGY